MFSQWRSLTLLCWQTGKSSGFVFFFLSFNVSNFTLWILNVFFRRYSEYKSNSVLCWDCIVHVLFFLQARLYITGEPFSVLAALFSQENQGIFCVSLIYGPGLSCLERKLTNPCNNWGKWWLSLFLIDQFHSFEHAEYIIWMSGRYGTEGQDYAVALCERESLMWAGRWAV